jgi:hypothetical protein
MAAIIPGYLFVNVELESDQYKELPWLPGTNGWVHKQVTGKIWLPFSGPGIDWLHLNGGIIAGNLTGQ